MSEGMGPRVRKVNSLLLNRSLQLRYILFVVGVAVVIAFVLGWLIYDQERRATKVLLDEMAELAGGEDAAFAALLEEQRPQLRARDQALIAKMVAAGVGLAVVLAFYVLFVTHRFAGPLYKMGSYLDEIARGSFPAMTPLRKGDWLGEFYQELQHSMDEVARIRREERAVVQRHASGIDLDQRAAELAARVSTEPAESDASATSG